MQKLLIFIEEKAKLLGLSEALRDAVKTLLTIRNPLFQRGLQLGLTNWGVPRQLEYFTETESYLEVPVGALNEVLLVLTEHGIEIESDTIVDNRSTYELPEIFSNINFKATLRGYQQEMLDACLDKTVGVIQAKTGAGKTLFALSLILKKQQSTLFLVNTIELANQAIESFVKHTNIEKEDVGFIGSGKFSLKPITVALHQTMARLSDQQFEMLNDHVGMVIADEVHICPAKTYYNTMTRLKARYKWGISATPKREDGLTRAIFFATGPLIHSVPEEKLGQVLITPEVEFVQTDYSFPLFSTQDYQPMITDLSEDVERNQLILDKVHEYPDNYSVLLCSRTSQVEALHKKLGNTSVMLTSAIPKKKRAEIMEQLQNKEKQIVISTYGLFSTGIDLPHLDALFLCAPMKSEIKLRQAAGRLMRQAEGKTKAIIIDFVDNNVGLLYNQARTRNRVLTTL